MCDMCTPVCGYNRVCVYRGIRCIPSSLYRHPCMLVSVSLTGTVHVYGPGCMFVFRTSNLLHTCYYCLSDSHCTCVSQLLMYVCRVLLFAVHYTVYSVSICVSVMPIETYVSVSVCYADRVYLYVSNMMQLRYMYI